MSTVTCSRCGTESAAGRKFCGECGAPLPLVCPSCGHPVPIPQKFCDECGAPLGGAAPEAPSMPEPRAASTSGELSDSEANLRGEPAATATLQEERRLVTALFCDLVGFTPLSESLDPEEVRDIQSDYFRAMSAQIERYGGIVEKYAGDAVLALFGTPIAHEDDAERAVLCALGMQSAIVPVAATATARWQVEPAIRVGVNTGEVVSGTWDASGRQDVAVTGDAVNTAARLQAVAELGEVLVSTETMRLTRRRIHYGERRDVLLKGKSGSVAVYPALGLRERFGERWETSEGATPLVGRDRELVHLLDAWVRAQGGEGQLVTLVGEAGVGKSRLVAELIDKVAANRAVRVVRARCLSYGQQIALWLIADLIRSLFGIAETDTLAETQSKLGSVLPALLDGSDTEARAEALDVLGEVLGLPPGDSLVAQADAEIRRQALIRSLRLVLGAVSARAAAIVVLEDMHWVDTASEEVLKEVLSDVPGLRLLALVAQRPGRTNPWSEWGWIERITLRPLGEAEAARLAGAVLGGSRLSPDLEAYVADRAGGNPFFVEELLRALEDTDGLVRQDGSIALAPGAAERLPSTLTEVLLARLDRLEGHARTVAQVASVIGRSFAVRLLARVMETEQTALDASLSALQQAEIAFPRRGSDLEYVFKHVTMREVAYKTLVQKRRQELHLATARAIADLYPANEYVELIAYHYARTQEHAVAAEWLERAGDRAAAIYANAAALENYQEARKRREQAGGEPTALARLDEKLGATLFTVGRYDEAVPVLERAVGIYRESRDLERAGGAAALLSRSLTSGRRSQEALARAQPLVDLLAWSGPSPALVQLHLAICLAFQNLGRYQELLPAAERAEEIARAIDDQRLLARAMERRASGLNFLGRAEEAGPVLHEAVGLLERVGDLTPLLTALGNLGEGYRLLGQLREAKHYNERALETAQRVGNPSQAAFMLMNLGEIELTLGGWEEAQEYLERAAATLATLPSASTTDPYIATILGGVFLAQGKWAEAEASLQRALVIAEEAEDRQALENIHVTLAELEVLRGEPGAAISRLESFIGRVGGERVRIETVFAWALLEAGETSRAEALIVETVERAQTQGERLALVDALRVKGMVLGKQGREGAVACLDEALALARSLPYPYAEARILAEMGMLEEALTIFRRLGAEKDVERVSMTLERREHRATPAAPAES